MKRINIAKALNNFGQLLIVAGIVFGFYYGSDNSGMGYALDPFVLSLYIIGGILSGLLCIGFARIVEAAEKYLNS